MTPWDRHAKLHSRARAVTLKLAMRRGALLLLGSACTSQHTAPVSDHLPVSGANQWSGSVHQLELGGDAGCALDGTGTVLCWSSKEPALRVVQGLPKVVEISVAGGSGCGRTEAGEVWCWPLTGGAMPRRAPVSAARARSPSDRGACVAREDAVTCWNAASSLADGELERPGVKGAWVSVLAKDHHIELSVKGRVIGRVQLEDVTELHALRRAIYTRDRRGKVFRFVPALGDPAPMGTGELAVGAGHVCVLSASGELACWGANDHGQISPRLPDAGLARRSLGSFPGMTRVHAYQRLTCLSDARSVRRCWGDCSSLPEGLGIPCEGRDSSSGVPLAKRGDGCWLESFDENAPCVPGDSIALMNASCDELGHWVISRRPVVGWRRGNEVYFQRGSASINDWGLPYPAADVARVPGRVYVLGYFFQDEYVPSLDRERAEAVRAAYAAQGVCPDKLVVVPAGLVPEVPTRRTGADIVHDPGAEEALRRSGIAAPHAPTR